MWHVDYGGGVIRDHESREEAKSAADAVAQAEERTVVVEEQPVVIARRIASSAACNAAACAPSRPRAATSPAGAFLANGRGVDPLTFARAKHEHRSKTLRRRSKSSRL